ncbi:MAG: alpha/beta fold hydrolase, partial [Gammaproteobacteria bacterium]|nr:alpha/beta fold hydrolase [Gammaproteobacteria bacterium]
MAITDSEPPPEPAVAGIPEINPQVYEWCVRVFDRVRHVLGVRIKMHHEQGQIDAGEIFLFNHFARIETFIPQYLIFRANGAFCRSVASAQFWQGSDTFGKLLTDIGAVPNSHPRLLPILAGSILRGQKIVIFPEGGMVKDRRVVDAAGEYRVYSRKSRERRKHHTGAARLAIGVQIFKQAVLDRDRRGNRSVLRQWADLLGLDGLHRLVEAARRPTVIVPASITFYPLRIQENVLVKGVELFAKNVSERMIEELIVEGNFVLKKTDMDIRLGEPIRPQDLWQWWERSLARYLALRIREPDEVFEFGREQSVADKNFCVLGLRSSVDVLRDRYMEEMYRSVTVNLSHVASHVILAALDGGRDCLEEGLFRRCLYLAIKHLQRHAEVHLHKALCDPQQYATLLHDTTEPLQLLLRSATAANLVALRDGRVCFLDKLHQEHLFDAVRLENPIEVYANEVRPVATVVSEVAAAVARAPELDDRDLARLRFDDELMQLRWDRYLYTGGKFDELNRQQTATADAEPFLLLPERPRRLGVVLVHGFLASPAEVREFGQRLYGLGYNVVGVRLRGHGTSPWDLRTREWQDWLASVRRGLEILEAFNDDICLVGFSTGGALALYLAA